jgi:hypothetical protein
MGRHLVYELREKLQAEAGEMDSPPDLSQFVAATELFYPGSRRGASGPLEYAASPVREDDEESDLHVREPLEPIHV